MHRVICLRCGIVSRQDLPRKKGNVAVRSTATGVHPSDCLRSQAKQLLAIGAIELHADLFRLMFISPGGTMGCRNPGTPATWSSAYSDCATSVIPAHSWIRLVHDAAPMRWPSKLQGSANLFTMRIRRSQGLHGEGDGGSYSYLPVIAARPSRSCWPAIAAGAVQAGSTPELTARLLPPVRRARRNSQGLVMPPGVLHTP